MSQVQGDLFLCQTTAQHKHHGKFMGTPYYIADAPVANRDIYISNLQDQSTQIVKIYIT